ncbi:hypothetical protein HAX54_027613 [Datura stramonium]|uniref:Uncharacterized protein n=1 Tax=Datura stramonium TaxID=4076 RepID=A0ABS8S8X6_DATST|nr:hypothetical protein [Datura stramonium]
MTPKVNKRKGVGSSSHGNKRSRGFQETPMEDASMPQQPPRCYGLRQVMEKEGKMWFKDHKESKYSHELFVDRDSLAFKFSHIVDKIHNPGLYFVFNNPREFLANWDPKERMNQVKNNGQIVNFIPVTLNRFLGMPSIDPQPFKDLILRPPYSDIRILSVARIWSYDGPPTNIGLGFKETFNNDDATDKEQARVDSNLESDGDVGDYSKMGEATYATTGNED